MLNQKFLVLLKFKLIGFGIYIIIILMRYTYRFRFYGLENRQNAAVLHQQGVFSFALWHEHLFGLILAHAGQRICAMASLSKDGDYISIVLRQLGYEIVRGSSSRGGRAAKDDLVEYLRRGYIGALTVDGPRGPRRRVKGGCLQVAQITGTAIVPLAFASSHSWIMTKSWDRFNLPKPFSRIAVYYGAPITVPANFHLDDSPNYKDKVTIGINEAEKEAAAALALWAKSAPQWSEQEHV